MAGRLLFSGDAVREAAGRVAAQLSRAVETPPAHLVAVLEGGLLWSADLLNAWPLGARRPQISYVRASSYGDRRVSSGKVCLTVPLHEDLRARCTHRETVVVDDVLETGATYRAVADLLRDCGARCVRSAVMVSRFPHSDREEYGMHWCGFHLADAGFLYGHGMDLPGDPRARDCDGIFLEDRGREV